MKRKRRFEVIRYSRRITFIHGDDAADFAAEQTTTDVALEMPEDAPVALAEVNNGGRARKAAAEMPCRRHFLRFFAWLRRQG